MFSYVYLYQTALSILFLQIGHAYLLGGQLRLCFLNVCSLKNVFFTYYTFVLRTVFHMLFICSFTTDTDKTTRTCVNLF